MIEKIAAVNTRFGASKTPNREETISRPFRQKEKIINNNVHAIHTIAYSSLSFPLTMSFAMKNINSRLTAIAII